MVLLFGTIVTVVVLYAAGRDCYVEAGLDRPGPSDGGGSIDNDGPGRRPDMPDPETNGALQHAAD